MPTVLVQDLTRNPYLLVLVAVTHVNSSKTGLGSIKVVATAGLSVMFVKWLSNMYHSTYAFSFCL
jgi:hypothetical protein